MSFIENLNDHFCKNPTTFAANVEIQKSCAKLRVDAQGAFPYLSVTCRNSLGKFLAGM